jgi:hypothetical protein
MGYETKFELDYISAQSDEWSVDKFNQDLNNNKTFGSYGLPLDSNDWDKMKWYSWDKDMKELSLEYPNLLLRLAGSGEDDGDMWCAYYMNGKSQMVKAQITYADPDMSNFDRVDLVSQRKQELIAEAQRIQLELDKLVSPDVY